MDQSEAYSAVRNPMTPAAVIADIAYQYPQMQADVAAHPAAYPGLLDWLDSVGDLGVKAAVSARRAADEAKNPPWDSGHAEPTVIKPLVPMSAPEPAPVQPVLPAMQPEPAPVQPEPAPVFGQPIDPMPQSADTGYSPAPVQSAPVPAPVDPESAAVPMPTEPAYIPAGQSEEPATLTKGQKVHNGLYIAKCVIVGGIFVVGGIAYLFSGVEGNWFGILAILYGIWVLTGIGTGGWRLFIY